MNPKELRGFIKWLKSLEPRKIKFKAKPNVAMYEKRCHACGDVHYNDYNFCRKCSKVNY